MPSIRQTMLVLWQAESLCQMLQNNHEFTKTKITTSRSRQKSSVVHEVQSFFVSLCKERSKQQKWKDLIARNIKVRRKLDTGAEVDILPQNAFKGLKNCSPLRSTNAVLTSFSNNNVTPTGVVTLTIKHYGNTVQTQFFVKHRVLPILGLPSCQELNLISGIDNVSPKSPQMPHAANGKKQFQYMQTCNTCYELLYRSMLKISRRGTTIEQLVAYLTRVSDQVRKALQTSSPFCRSLILKVWGVTDGANIKQYKQYTFFLYFIHTLLYLSVVFGYQPSVHIWFNKTVY